jgi:hypothetical protein
METLSDSIASQAIQVDPASINTTESIESQAIQVTEQRIKEAIIEKYKHNYLILIIEEFAYLDERTNQVLLKKTDQKKQNIWLNLVRIKSKMQISRIKYSNVYKQHEENLKSSTELKFKLKVKEKKIEEFIDNTLILNDSLNTMKDEDRKNKKENLFKHLLQIQGVISIFSSIKTKGSFLFPEETKIRNVFLEKLTKMYSAIKKKNSPITNIHSAVQEFTKNINLDIKEMEPFINKNINLGVEEIELFIKNFLKNLGLIDLSRLGEVFKDEFFESISLDLMEFSVLDDVMGESLKFLQNKENGVSEFKNYEFLVRLLSIHHQIKCCIVQIQKIIDPTYEIVLNERGSIDWLFSRENLFLNEDTNKKIVKKLKSSYEVEIKNIKILFQHPDAKLFETIEKLTFSDDNESDEIKKKCFKIRNILKKQQKMTVNPQQSLNFGNVKNQHMDKGDSPKGDQSSQPSGGESPVDEKPSIIETTQVGQSNQFEESKGPLDGENRQETGEFVDSKSYIRSTSTRITRQTSTKSTVQGSKSKKRETTRTLSQQNRDNFQSSVLEVDKQPHGFYTVVDKDGVVTKTRLHSLSKAKNVILEVKKAEENARQVQQIEKRKREESQEKKLAKPDPKLLEYKNRAEKRAFEKQQQALIKLKLLQQNQSIKEEDDEEETQ